MENNKIHQILFRPRHYERGALPPVPERIYVESDYVTNDYVE